MDAVTGWWDDFFWGSVTVVQVFFFSLILMILFGLIGAAIKFSDSKVAQKVAGGYTVIFRGTPEILVILLLYFGSAIALTSIARIFNPEVKFVDVPPVWAGTIATALIVVRHRNFPRCLSGRQTRQHRGRARPWHVKPANLYLYPHS